MKLIPLIILMISLAVGSKARESFTFPPQFQGSHSSMFNAPDKQFYLPPESHTPMPYFPMKNFNNLPFPYLPPTVTKSPSGSPSPFPPIVLSTTLLPMKSDEDDEDDEDNKSSTPIPPYFRSPYNRTQKGPSPKMEKREMRPIPKNFQHPIDRIDTKLPYQFSSETTTVGSLMQAMSPRSIVISDIQRDHNSMDQMKAASYQGAQYVPQPNVFISTTETAIPILRLSNEMDLDGSFSYEALGADQTHYVQHSRMENMGSNKEEQVVEGSYSYVGDNGKTYTVHYIADSNGFRASGDHLPVPPPVPEIIQRAVQYNIAEELKKPPGSKSWNEIEQENELSESEKRHRFAVSPPHLSNLFTGKTPESFSHSFSQASNTQNNLLAAASSQTPIQTIDFTDQNKQNSGTISPQITFLASQGAHVPSVNAPQQQNIGRIFTTERPALPQIVNYEANMKDTAEQESNKALWRWQYGLNAQNSNQNQNVNMEKNLISRSSGEDDISINFSDMTADQYTKMIQQQFNHGNGQNVEAPHQFEKSNNQGQYYNNFNGYSNVGNEKQYRNENFNTVNPLTSESQYSTERISPSTHTIDWYKQQNNYNNQYNSENTKEANNEVSQTSRPKLITQDHFIPQSQTVTQKYNYDDSGFESRRTRILHKNANLYDMNLNVLPLSYEKSMQYNTTPKPLKEENESKVLSTDEPLVLSTSGNIKFSDFIVPEDKNDFKPIFTVPEVVKETTTTTTTEANIEEILEENIFLKNLFRNNKNDQDIGNKIKDETKNLQVKPLVETRTDKYPKFIQFDSKPYNEIKTIKKKPIDLAEIMNYLSRNQFESSKVRTKPKPQMHGNYKQKNEMQYFTGDDDQEMVEDKNTRNYRTLQQQEELRGVIKNYKVLQRNNNFANAEHDNVDGLQRNLSPPPVKVVNLPPLGRAGPTMKSYLPPVYV
ncbi:uncharacterized protein LOC142978745 [Anticarsia gemmatalis]|uniref:uncharacterized protein LOC142978745 n=1 Tax=Anticarsia gemmatalis TaxID=129554 RepID=UPI003F75A967